MRIDQHRWVLRMTCGACRYRGLPLKRCWFMTEFGRRLGDSGHSADWYGAHSRADAGPVGYNGAYPPDFTPCF